MSIDPVTTDASTGASFNRYTYGNNNPYKYVDPDGRQIVIIVGKRSESQIEPLYPIESRRNGDPVARKLVDIYNRVTSPTPSMPPEDDESEKRKKSTKRPNDDLEPGDEIDLNRFTRRVKNENGQTEFEDPKSGYRISKDRGGDRAHGGSAWKLIDRFGGRVKTLNADGKVLRK